jgi:hypothetical protein
MKMTVPVQVSGIVDQDTVAWFTMAVLADASVERSVTMTEIFPGTGSAELTVASRHTIFDECENCPFGHGLQDADTASFIDADNCRG